jgi:putative peptidoglycan lipid II flippase
VGYNKKNMKRVWGLLSRQQKTVGSAAMIMMSMVATSRVLGLVRDRLLSARFAPEDLGVYFAAFRLPNLLFELLVLGAVTTAFIPVFTKYVSEQKEKEGFLMSSILINVGCIALAVLSIPVLVFTKQISRLLAPGFTPVQIDQMASFTQFMVLFQVLPLLVGNFFTGILQSYNLFLVPAAAPVVYNVGIIIGILFFTKSAGLYAPVYGVGIGAFLFMLIQIPPLIMVGYRHRFSFRVKHPGVREVLKLMGPRTIGMAVSQVDSTVDLVMASILGARMVTIFNFAQQLQQLPVGLFGATIAQAALPSLSYASAKKESNDFMHIILHSVNQVLFFILPISVLFIVLRVPIVRLVFGASRFDWQATTLTGATLATFSISLFAQAIVQIFARGFYALYDTKTPVIIAIISIGLNSLLSVIAIQFLHWPVWSLGLSTSIASMVNATLLFIILSRRIGGYSITKSIIPPLKMVIAALATGVMLYLPLKLFDQLVFDTTRVVGLILLTGTASTIGFATYVFLSWVFGVGEVHSFVALLGKVRRPAQVYIEPVSEVVNGSIQDTITP